MPILTNDLRSPEERRTDQLTILKRRPPPPRSAGRFFKILADTGASIGAFDPAFDSDADTDGPTSGSSIWRREFSRVRSASSTSTGLLVDDKRIPSCEKIIRQDSDGSAFDRVTSRKESDDSFVFEGFVRDRAASFYGKDNDVVEVVGEGMRRVSEKTLRAELEEDYDMFYHPKGKENQSPNEKVVSKAKAEESQEKVSHEQVSHEQVSQEQESPEQETKASESAKPKKKTTADSTRSLESGVGSGESESMHTLKGFRLNEDPDRFTVSIISDDNSEEDMEEVAALVPCQHGTIPLFVEEIGRVPRAMIIDGKVTRVRISPDRGSFREAVSRARRSSFGWAFRKSGWFGGRRKSVDGAEELHPEGRRRRGWWRMKRLLFRHGSDF